MKLQTFSYDTLPDTSKVIVQQRTSEIKTLMRKTASDIIEIGHKLIEVKEELQHGEFGKWLDSEFGWSYRTAKNFMNVADSFKSANFAEIDIAPSALYMLSEPSIPEIARSEAVERAEKGEQITHSTAKDIKKKHTGPEIIEEYEDEAQEIISFLDEQEAPEKRKSARNYIDTMLYRFCTEWDVPVLEVKGIADELEELAKESAVTNLQSAEHIKP